MAGGSGELCVAGAWRCLAFVLVSAALAHGETYRNQVYLEYVGNGIRNSLSYSRVFLSFPRGGLQASIGCGLWGHRDEGLDISFPVGLGALLGRKASKLDLGLYYTLDREALGTDAYYLSGYLSSRIGYKLIWRHLVLGITFVPWCLLHSDRIEDGHSVGDGLSLFAVLPSFGVGAGVAF